jgi:hypothetical protein
MVYGFFSLAGNFSLYVHANEFSDSIKAENFLTDWIRIVLHHVIS